MREKMNRPNIRRLHKLEHLETRMLLAGDLAIQITPDFARVDIGSSVTYSIEVTNNTDTPIGDIQLSESTSGIESVVLKPDKDVFAANWQMPPQLGEGFSIIGTQDEGRLGESVGSGDVNGDGISDVIARSGSQVFGDHLAETYVFFGGGQELTGEISPIHYLDGETGFVIPGIDGGFASSTQSGDFNGDGIDDILLGAPVNYSGVVYVLYGKETGFDTLTDVSLLDASEGAAIFGVTDGDATGANVWDGGDINGDGVNDIMISAPRADFDGDGFGEAHVVFGARPGLGSTLELSQLSASEGFTISGGRPSPLGDIDGDGFSDIGLDTASGPIIVFGRAEFNAFMQVDEISKAIRLNGTEGLPSLSGLGDINGDGISDFSVASPPQDTHYIVYGHNKISLNDFSVGEVDGTTGFLVTQSNRFGFGTIEKGGDLNGDGITDIVIADSIAERGHRDFVGGQGEVYVVFGGRQHKELDVTELDGSNGFAVTGPHHESRFGVDASTGDINDDGVDDLIIGASDAGNDGIPRGAVYVVYGRTKASLVEGVVSLGPDETAQFRGDGIVLENANRIGVSITAATGRETVTQTSDQLVGIRGDLDQDGVVGFADFLTLRENFGIREKATPAEGDLNFDGAVNFPDFLLFSLNFGSSDRNDVESPSVASLDS